VPHHAFNVLQERSDQEGRSLSNLAAYLLESCLERTGLALGNLNPSPGQARVQGQPRHAPTPELSW